MPHKHLILGEMMMIRGLMIIFLFVWLFLLYSVLISPSITYVAFEPIPREITLKEPDRTALFKGVALPPPSIKEIQEIMKQYLSELHHKLGELKSHKAKATTIWETFLDVTSNTIMKWYDENEVRFEKPRDDGSIFVSLGTYRDPYCPMTLKSIYSQAAHPNKVFVSLFQQNCFEKVCRTGVLAGGEVRDAQTDVNCYDEFCKSPEGQMSNACHTGQIRVFNVNESESLGPYMARYLGSKFHQGEQYYLQIDSHSEFVSSWDTKLIRMVETAPAALPVISGYPPDSTFKWRDTPGFRMCDAEFAPEEIEWQIIRLAPSGEYPLAPEPPYAPYIAAGFLFGPASLLYDVPFDPLLPWIFMVSGGRMRGGGGGGEFCRILPYCIVLHWIVLDCVKWR
jgi:[Skp1-protein]-hydroxyproline N-acetylglucosaminyltransferase